MSKSRNNKRPVETIDLTGSSPLERPAKSPRFNGVPGVPIRDNLLRTQAGLAPSSSPSQPPQSQASQFRNEEDGGNELVDDFDMYYGDPATASYELYGETLCASPMPLLYNFYRHSQNQGCGMQILYWLHYDG